MVLALATLAGSITVGAISFIVAQASGANDIAPWVQGGSMLSSVGALIYIAKKFASGELVAVNTHQLTRDSADRERRLEALVAAQAADSDALRDLVSEGNRALGRLHRYLEERE